MKKSERIICDNAKRKGQNAAYSGKALVDNPYVEGSFGHGVWKYHFEQTCRSLATHD